VTSAAIAVKEAQDAGIKLFLDADKDVRIRYALERKGELAPVIAKLRALKPEVTKLLRDRAQRSALAHLAHFVGKRVWTPDGPAKLVEVQDYVVVEYSDGKRLRWYDADGVVVPYA
jgi:hypothetical protein